MAMLRPAPLTSLPPQKLAQPKTVGHNYRALLLFLLTTALLLGGLGSRLAYLQLIQNHHFRNLADHNRIRLIPHPPERGRIMDRNGVLLAGSQLSHAVFVWPLAQSPQEWQTTIPTLAGYLNIPADEIRDRLEQAGYRSPLPVRIMRNASPAIVTELEERGPELPGVIVEAEAIRHYPNGDTAAHILGYTGEIPSEQLDTQSGEDYRLGDIVGLMGSEELFEPLLRGQWGGRQVEVDAAGEVLQILGEHSAQAGHAVTLTMDLRLQQKAEQLLANRKGAVVAMDPRDGAILAMASYPTFDPNLFSSHITQDQWSALQEKAFPFLNRAVRAFPPASTFKIITTAAGIESGIFPAGTTLRTAPYVQVAGHRFWDWNRAGFGVLNYRQAMAYSSDTFFYQIALGTKGGPIQHWSRRFGLGQPTGLGLTGESNGIVPDEAWKQEHIQEPWYAGDTVNMSIGQGFVTATPLQMAVVTAAVANGGWRVRPILSYQALNNTGEVTLEREPVGISATTDQILQQGLRDVIVYGTGRSVALPYGFPSVAGKSGTAEDPPRLSHAWFVSYAPAEAPEIVVVAFLENSGGGGGSQAGPICRELMMTYFQLKAQDQSS